TCSTPRWSSTARASRTIVSSAYRSGSCGLSEAPWPRASVAMTRRPWSTSASIIPDRPQLSAWSAPNPWSSNTAGPAPRAVYAMRAPSNDATESGMKGTLRCADELGRQRVEVERVGVGDREQRDAAQRPDEQRGVGDGIDVAPNLATGDALTQVVLDY